MKGQWKTGGRWAAILLATAFAGFSQTSVSQNRNARQPGMASPGTINYVEGQATLDGQPLTAQSVGSTMARPNQTIGATNGYVEVLLTPGAFLRIGHNSEVRLMSASLAGVEVEVTQGSALVEVADLVDGSRLDVAMNGATVELQKKGLYSFDATQRSVRVLDGKAEVVGATGKTTLKKGNQVLLASDQPLKKRDFETKPAEHEPLYVWSRVRSEQESQANMNAANSLAAGGAWYGPGWYWDPYWSGYAFLPGSGFVYSPFGSGFYGYGYPGIWRGGLGYRYYGGRAWGHGYYHHPGHIAGGIRSGGGFHGGHSGSFHSGHGGGRGGHR
jgi:hypothetical protein